MTDERRPDAAAWEDIVTPGQVVEGAVDIAEVVADLGARMLAHAGLEHWSCTARESMAPLFRTERMVSLRLLYAPPEGGSLDLTVRIPTRPKLDLRPLVVELNRAFEFEQRSGKSFVLIRGEPFGRVALVDTDQRRRLERADCLIVEDADRLAAALAEAGFDWAYGSTVWPQWFARTLGRIGALLADAGEAAPAFHWEPEGPGFRLEIRAGQQVLADQWFSGAFSLVAMLHTLNTALARADVSSRVLLVADEASIPSRIAVLDRAWASAVVEAGVAERHALEAEWSATAWGPTDLKPPAHCPTPAELVGEAGVLESDFKCSARETDLPSVTQSLISFARLNGSVDELARRTGHGYELVLQVEGVTKRVAMDGAKYADVRPILSVLNECLPADTNWRIFAFQGPGYSGGVLRADREQHATLRRWWHVVDPWPSE